jgi:hypothetical protein
VDRARWFVAPSARRCKVVFAIVATIANTEILRDRSNDFLNLLVRQNAHRYCRRLKSSLPKNDVVVTTLVVHSLLRSSFFLWTVPLLSSVESSEWVRHLYSNAIARSHQVFFVAGSRLFIYLGIITQLLKSGRWRSGQ